MPIDAEALERLRKLRKLGLKQGARDLAPPRPAPPVHEFASQTVLPGELSETRHGPAWVATTRYPLDSEPELAAPLAIAAEAYAAAGRDPALLAFDPAAAAFVDTETTGLSLGTGTYTFLIGIGTYEDAEFVVRQYFMRNPAEERGQVHLVEEALGRCNCIVSFNGRGFDWPLIQNRFRMAGVPLPLDGGPHLDLLPVARRVWRAYLGSCSLGELEREVLNVHRSAADVPGWMIPGVYRDFYQSGGGAQPTELMARVFYHNLIDVTSMARLAARLGRLFEQAEIAARLVELHPLVCVSLARCFEALDWFEASMTAYQIALDGGLPDGERVEVLRSYSLWLKRIGRRAEAADLWETWITSVADPELTPFVELAKHHEWHTGDLLAARSWAAWALRMVQQRGSSLARDGAGQDGLERRLARLERKLAGARPEEEAPGEE